MRKRWPWLRHLFADGAYDRGQLMSVAAYRDFVVEVVRKLHGQQGFQPLPRRWAEPTYKVPLGASQVEGRRRALNAPSAG